MAEQGEAVFKLPAVQALQGPSASWNSASWNTAGIIPVFVPDAGGAAFVIIVPG